MAWAERLWDFLQYHPAFEARKAYLEGQCIYWPRPSAHVDEEGLLWAPGFEPSPSPGTRLAGWACHGAVLPSSG